jgi:hypothetical protein
VELSQVIEAGGDIRMLGAQRPLVDRQGTLVEGLGCVIAPLRLVEESQAAEAGGDVGVLGT